MSFLHSNISHLSTQTARNLFEKPKRSKTQKKHAIAIAIAIVVHGVEAIDMPHIQEERVWTNPPELWRKGWHTGSLYWVTS